MFPAVEPIGGFAYEGPTPKETPRSGIPMAIYGGRNCLRKKLAQIRGIVVIMFLGNILALLSVFKARQRRQAKAPR